MPKHGSGQHLGAQTWGVSLAKKSSQLMVPLTAREAKKSVMMLGLHGVMHVSAAGNSICQLMYTELAGATACLPLMLYTGQCLGALSTAARPQLLICPCVRLGTDEPAL